MIHIRKSEERGGANHGWLRAKHTFSFAEYYDPTYMGFRALKVINEDRVAGGSGFPTHGHRDMEIITYIIEGALEHKDSMGNTAIIRPGEVQRMSAGTGVRHSEFNPLPDRETHLLQIWIQPDKAGYVPSYEQKDYHLRFSRGGLVLVASQNGREGSLTVHQNAEVYVAKPRVGAEIEYPLKAGRHAWIQMVRGDLLINGEKISAGDGASISNEPMLSLVAESDAEFLLFDLA